MSHLPGLFVVGTDTGVGKTFIAAAIARSMIDQGHRVGVLKPVATGCGTQADGLISDDAQILAQAVGGNVLQSQVAPLVFSEPLAPCVAARREGTLLEHATVEKSVREGLDWWASRVDVMVVEGVGGLLCPLAEGTTVADLATTLDYPLVVVARRGLGTLNHTLLTVEAAKIRGLRIAGLILNSADPASDPLAESTNAEELARRLPGLPVLAEVAYLKEPLALSTQFSSIDWYSRSKLPRSRTWKNA